MNEALAKWMLAIVALSVLSDGQRTQLEQLVALLELPVDDPGRITAAEFRDQFLALVEGRADVPLVQALGLDPLT